MTNHSTDKCYKLRRDIKTLKEQIMTLKLTKLTKTIVMKRMLILQKPKTLQMGLQPSSIVPQFQHKGLSTPP